jgi:hypothetical protein
VQFAKDLLSQDKYHRERIDTSDHQKNTLHVFQWGRKIGNYDVLPKEEPF